MAQDMAAVDIRQAAEGFVKSNAFHLSLWRSVDAAFAQCKMYPSQTTTYIVWDHMASIGENEGY